MSDYIPRSDADFIPWSQSFLAYLMTHTDALGVLPEDVTSISTGVLSFEGVYQSHLTAQHNATAAKETKNASRTAIEQAIRTLVRQIQANPAVTDTQRASLGITVPDRNLSVDATSVASRPLGKVDTSQRLRHAISFTDEDTPTSRAKPGGVMGCEIWVKVLPAGEAAPSDPSELTFLALDTASPYTEYSGAEASKTAHYLLRWVKTNGEKGPWSETVSATIVG